MHTATVQEQIFTLCFDHIDLIRQSFPFGMPHVNRRRSRGMNDFELSSSDPVQKITQLTGGKLIHSSGIFINHDRISRFPFFRQNLQKKCPFSAILH